MAMKTESIRFSTQKDIDAIISAIRTVAGNLNTPQIDKIEDQPDAFGQMAKQNDIQVTVSGVISFTAGHGAVQVYVDDAGSERHVELIAMGVGNLAHSMSFYTGGAVLPRFKASKQLQETLAQALS